MFFRTFLVFSTNAVQMLLVVIFTSEFSSFFTMYSAENIEAFSLKIWSLDFSLSLNSTSITWPISSTEEFLLRCESENMPSNRLFRIWSMWFSEYFWMIVLMIFTARFLMFSFVWAIESTAPARASWMYRSNLSSRMTGRYTSMLRKPSRMCSRLSMAPWYIVLKLFSTWSSPKENSASHKACAQPARSIEGVDSVSMTFLKAWIMWSEFSTRSFPVSLPVAFAAVARTSGRMSESA